MRKSLAGGLLLLMLSPFFILLLKFPLHWQLELGEVWWALKNTLAQATLSALGALLMGSWVALGLITLSGSRRHIANVVCLLPNFLPPLFTLLVAYTWVDPFPVGVIGVAFVHTLINFGIVAVSLAMSIEGELAGMGDLARVEGSGRYNFIRKVYFPILKRSYISLFLFVFAICFASFSVPLIAGGGRGTTLEVLIYEKIRLSMDWGGAVLLSLFQFILMAALAWRVSRNFRPAPAGRGGIEWLGFKSGLFVLGSFVALFLWGYWDGVFLGLRSLESIVEIKNLILLAFAGTLFIGLTTGVLTLGLLTWIAFVREIHWAQNFVRAYVAPSTTLTAFAFLMLGPNAGPWSYAKIPVALSLLFIGALYRMGWESELRRVEGQAETAYVLGASPGFVFRKILWPQVKVRALFLAGLAGAWACGDFALSRILAYNDLSLGLMTETLMSSYRLNLAHVLSLGVLLAGLICFLIFWGSAYVQRRKSA